MSNKNKQKADILPDLVVIKPLGDRTLPDTAEEKPKKGTVVAIGPRRISKSGRFGFDMAVKEGDTVLYGKYAGTEIDLGDSKLVILSIEDILGLDSGRDNTLAVEEWLIAHHEILVEDARVQAPRRRAMISFVLGLNVSFVAVLLLGAGVVLVGLELSGNVLAICSLFATGAGFLSYKRLIGDWGESPLFV